MGNSTSPGMMPLAGGMAAFGVVVALNEALYVVLVAVPPVPSPRRTPTPALRSVSTSAMPPAGVMNCAAAKNGSIWIVYEPLRICAWKVMRHWVAPLPTGLTGVTTGRTPVAVARSYTMPFGPVMRMTFVAEVGAAGDERRCHVRAGNGERQAGRRRLAERNVRLRRRHGELIAVRIARRSVGVLVHLVAEHQLVGAIDLVQDLVADIRPDGVAVRADVRLQGEMHGICGRPAADADDRDRRVGQRRVGRIVVFELDVGGGGLGNGAVERNLERAKGSALGAAAAANDARADRRDRLRRHDAA